MSEFFRKSLYRPSSPSLLQVKRARQVSPGFRSVTLTGEGLKTFPQYCPAAHVKIFLPREGQPRPVLPTRGPQGPVWPAGELKPIVRTYSVRSFRPEALELDIEFAIHTIDGPATNFAKRAAPGDYVGLSYPGGPDPMIPAAKHYMFAGDMAALPALASILEHLPPDASGEMLIRIDDAADIRALEAPTGVRLQWIVAPPHDLRDMNEIFRSLPLPTDNVYCWIGGEHALVVSLRKYLVSERAVATDALYALPYWRLSFDEEGYHKMRDELMAEVSET